MNLINISHSPVLEAVFAHAGRTPDKTAIVTVDGSTVSYSALVRNILRAALWLSEKGISRGSRVMISAEKEVEFIYLYLASHLLGAVNVVVDAHNDTDHLQYIAEKTQPALFIGLDLPETETIAYGDIHLPAASDEMEVEELIGRIVELRKSSEPLNSEDTADIMFTSGTTGNPKGVLLSHANIAGSALNINSFIGNGSDDVELLGLPLCHSFGLGRLRCNMLTGAAVVLHNGFANLKSVFSAFEIYNITGFGMVPAIWAYIKRFSGTRIARYAPQIRYIEIGSAALPEEDKRMLSEIFPDTRICMHYGLTEASRSAFVEFHDDKEHLGSVGRRVGDQVEIAVFDSDGHRLPAGEEGEICVRGNMVTKGYLDPADSEDAFYRDDRAQLSYIDGNGEGHIRGDFFRTGDGGRMDEEGYVYLTDRIKEIINVGGKKVSPVEIEETAKRISGAESVCMAVPDPTGILGEVPKLLVLKSSLTMDPEDLSRALAEDLASYKLPRFVDVVSALPLTANGKKKRHL